MEHTKEELLAALEAIQTIEPNEYDYYVGSTREGCERYTKEEIDAVDNAECLANELLCTGPFPDRKVREYLSEHGYKVYPGEMDSFGWLTGCIQKRGNRGILVFG